MSIVNCFQVGKSAGIKVIKDILVACSSIVFTFLPPTITEGVALHGEILSKIGQTLVKYFT